MKVLTVLDPGTSKISPRTGQGACCAPAAAKSSGDMPVAAPAVYPEMIQAVITGYMEVPGNRVPVVSTSWNRADRMGEIRSRLSNFRMNYAVPPGLYAVGTPGAESDILVSANYKLSFDMLRRELKGRDLWILVIDTAGINVWCAAGEGTFGTEELSQRIVGHGLGGIVTHRRIIVPQLGAPGIDAAEIKRRTGFRVHYGPVRSSDLPAYLEDGYRATPEMRTVTFSSADRLVLTPIELIPALKSYFFVAVIFLILFGLDTTGILFRKAWSEGMPMVAMGLAAVLSGALLTPVLLPVIPFRSFAVKGLITGTAVTALMIHGAGAVGRNDGVLTAMSYIFFPALSSFLALQFTGATTYTSLSGVTKEMKYAIPLYIAAASVSLVLVVIYKLMDWGIL